MSSALIHIKQIDFKLPSENMHIGTVPLHPVQVQPVLCSILKWNLIKQHQCSPLGYNIHITLLYQLKYSKRIEILEKFAYHLG